MYNNKDEYREATKDASVNTYGNKKKSNSKLIILNLLLASTLGLMGYVGFESFTNQTTFLKKTNVLGINHIVDDTSFISMLNNSEVDILNRNKDTLQSTIDSLVSTSDVKEDAYVKSITKEILPDRGTQIVTIIVKKGDTLVSLAEEYYGDSLAYNRIIEANNELTKKSHTIYIGESLNLPY